MNARSLLLARMTAAALAACATDGSVVGGAGGAPDRHIPVQG